MRYEVEVNGRSRTVSVTRSGDGFAVDVDGRIRYVDAVRIDAQILSLLVGEVWPKSDSPPGSDGGASYEVTVSSEPAGRLVIHAGSSRIPVTVNGRRRQGSGQASGAHLPESSRRIVAPMPGKIVRVLVQAGDAVRVRQPLVVVEAMKMENELRAGRDGRVAAIHVREGASVEAGALLLELA